MPIARSIVSAVEWRTISNQKRGKRTKRSPHLPRHDQATTDYCRRVLSRVDRHRHLLQAHADTEQDTADGEFPPGLRGSAADGSEEGEDGADKDGSASAAEIVDGVRDPGGAREY